MRLLLGADAGRDTRETIHKADLQELRVYLERNYETIKPMGYTTEFTGELLFTQDLTVSQVNYLRSILGEDCRDHKDWETSGLYRIDLELNHDFTGIRWDGSEKTYDMDQLVNVVIRLMRKKWPEFGLRGELLAQGEQRSDRWKLVIGDDGFAKKAPSGKPVAVMSVTDAAAKLVKAMEESGWVEAEANYYKSMADAYDDLKISLGAYKKALEEIKNNRDSEDSDE